MTTVERIKELAGKRGLSLQRVAENAGIGINSIYRWNTKVPSTQSLQKVAKALGTTVDYLLGNTDNPSPDQPLTKNQKLIAYSIDPDISDEERQAIIEMVQAAKKFRRRI